MELPELVLELTRAREAAVLLRQVRAELPEPVLELTRPREAAVLVRQVRWSCLSSSLN